MTSLTIVAEEKLQTFKIKQMIIFQWSRAGKYKDYNSIM